MLNSKDPLLGCTYRRSPFSHSPQRMVVMRSMPNPFHAFRDSTPEVFECTHLHSYELHSLSEREFPRVMGNWEEEMEKIERFNFAYLLY